MDPSPDRTKCSFVDVKVRLKVRARFLHQKDKRWRRHDETVVQNKRYVHNRLILQFKST